MEASFGCAGNRPFGKIPDSLSRRKPLDILNLVASFDLQGKTDHGLATGFTNQ
jgi:hypothetical protein